ncbi:hypothetical protein KOW79_013387 [Hemibagrus wyckioides]|uniref:Uncharacterized protein n=1 Tax=Hemibagrus wyckioides TaxID=337641 RepID=A0A9D3NMH2_9TELE|nr:hypothetical protein KOW79_013387 [Hemibagrus wyckioides]
MATPTAAPMTRLRRLSREAASARKSSSPLGGMVPASVDGVVQKNTHWQCDRCVQWERGQRSARKISIQIMSGETGVTLDLGGFSRHEELEKKESEKCCRPVISTDTAEKVSHQDSLKVMNSVKARLA